MAFEVPPLPYDYNALEPHIDEQTMRIHHDKHHQAYVDNANKALDGTEWADRPVEEVLQEPRLDPRGQAHGRAQQRRRPREPHPLLADHEPERRRRSRTARWPSAIDAAFGGFDAFKEKLSQAGDHPLRERLGLARLDGSGLAGRCRRRTRTARSRRGRRLSSGSTSGSTPTT